MLLLTGVADKVNITITPAAPMDVHASFMDNDGTDVFPGRQNTATSVAADVVDPPAVGFSRHVRTLNIRNTDPAVSSEVAVLLTAGPAAEMSKVTLGPGEKLSFVDGQGFRVYDQNGVIQ
jgi:hypothetical protein